MSHPDMLFPSEYYVDVMYGIMQRDSEVTGYNNFCLQGAGDVETTFRYLVGLYPLLQQRRLDHRYMVFAIDQDRDRSELQIDIRSKIIQIALPRRIVDKNIPDFERDYSLNIAPHLARMRVVPSVFIGIGEQGVKKEDAVYLYSVRSLSPHNALRKLQNRYIDATTSPS